MPIRNGFGGLLETEAEAASNALSIFDTEAVENILRERKSCQAKPSSLHGTGPFEIYLPSDRYSYIDPGSFRIHAKIKIRRYNNNGVVVDLPVVNNDHPTNVYPLNLFSKCIFKDIEVELQHSKISLNASNTYPIKAYVTTLSSYGSDADKTHLRCSYFHKDSPGQQDNFEQNANGLARLQYISQSRMVHINDNLHTELTSTSRYIVPGVDIKFRFIIEDPSLFLMSRGGPGQDDYVIEFHDFYLTYDRILLKDAAHASMEKRLLSSPAIYPITRTEIRTKGFAVGLTSLEWNNAYQGTLPETVMVCMNLQTAADRRATQNIFNFQHFNMREMSLIVNSRRIPTVPLTFDFANNEAIDAYRFFFDNIGVDITNAQTLVNYTDFKNGTTIIPFDLTNDRCALYHAHEKQEGNISIDIKLTAATAEAVNVYCICIYRDYFYISGPVDNRQVTLVPPQKR